MKLIASGVTFSAAIVRSPSFSRSSSSTTMTMRPARMASMASSIRENGESFFAIASGAAAVFGPRPRDFARSFRLLTVSLPLPTFIAASLRLSWTRGRQRQARDLGGADDVLPHHVALEVHAIAHARRAQVRVLHRERHDLHVEAIVRQPRDRQTDAVDGDRSFVHDER